jgi:hypothetical protein
MRANRWWAGALVALASVGVSTASTVIGLSIEDQARLSRHIVIGEVVRIQGIDDPAMGIESAITLRVQRALKGGAAAGTNVTFHSRSGEIDGVISTAVGEAVFQVGTKVLVFVEDIGGRLYNIGLSYGVFNVLEDRSGRPHFVRALQDGLSVVDDAGTGNGPFTLEDLATRISWAARRPAFDSALVRDAAVAVGR